MTNLTRIEAMKDAHIGIAAVYLDRKVVVFENGLKFKILRMYDEYWEETDDPEEAWYYDFGHKKHGYGYGRLSQEERQMLQ